MAYTRRYEDSYLDNEEDEFDGKNTRDAERVVALIQKGEGRSDEDQALIEKLTGRLTLGARMPGAPGSEALEGLQLIAEAYAAEGMPTESAETWAVLIEIAEALGNRDLYYYAIEKMGS